MTFALSAPSASPRRKSICSAYAERVARLLADFSEACLTPRRAVPKEPRVRELIHTWKQLNGGGELDARARDVLARLADIASAASSSAATTTSSFGRTISSVGPI